MPSVWDANANTNLLISINEISNPKPPDWKEVAEKMKAKGYGSFTHEACRQHYQKLRKDAKIAADGNGSTPTTPAKKATPGKAAGSARKGPKNSKSTLDSSAADDNESFETPPSKKRKHAATLKKESYEESEDGSVYGSSGPDFFKAEEKVDKKDFFDVDEYAEF